MTAPSARFSCQTYAWEMSGDRYIGQLHRFLDIANEAGFAGLEPEPVMLGDYRNISAAHAAIDGSGVALSSVAFVAGWRGRVESEQERAEADHYIRFLQSFPESRMVLVQAPGADREDLRERQQNALGCINAVARRAADAGVTATFHPNSPAGSVFRERGDYDILLTGLDDRVVNYTPDVGHIARGGMDPLDIVRTYRERVDHIHLKDFAADGWKRTGEGAVDFAGIVRYLHGTGFDGWIVVEDESPSAVADPDEVTLASGRYVRSTLAPIVAGARANEDKEPNEA
jgi:inosose dehydratase